MKFLYEYRTKDNVRHEGEIAAPDREAAFALLKARGIRPGSMTEAPGFFNKLFGKGKRWLAIGVLAVLSVALAVALGRARTQAVSQPSSVDQTLDSPMRRQLIGDSGVIEKGIKTGWADIFKDEGDRFLASFAVPGVAASVRNTTEEEIRKALSADSRSCDPQPTDSIEARQVRAIVSGIKDEIRGLLKEGWTITEIGRSLAKRQDREIGYFNRAKNEIEQAKKSNLSEGELSALWEKKNDELRNMGIRLVPMPE